MRIAIVGLTYPFRGGIAHYTSILHRELAKKHRTHLISLKRQYPLILFPGRTQIDTSRIRIAAHGRPLISPLNPSSWVKAYREIASLEPDLVLVQWWNPFFAPAFGTLARLLRKAQIKTCFICHNVFPHERHMADRFLLGYALRSARDFILHSQAEVANLKSINPHARARVAPHPIYDVFRINDSMGKEEARMALDVSGNVLLFFGHVRRYKGLDLLLEAMPSVLAQIQCTLLVVGEFYDDKRRYLRMISELGIRDRVRIVDRYIPNEEVQTYFLAADLVVAPYRAATQSGMVQVAFAFDKPVVATSVGGIPEVIENYKTGIIVEPNDPEALAQAIIDYYRLGLQDALSENIARGKGKFSWQQVVDLIESIALEA